MNSIAVCFVCLGNICRSPTRGGGDACIRWRRRSSRDRIVVDSAGTGDWHIGQPPDERAQHAAGQRRATISRRCAAARSPPPTSRASTCLIAMDDANAAALGKSARRSIATRFAC